MISLQTLSEAVVSGDSNRVQALCRQALAAGESPMHLLRFGLLPGFERVNGLYLSNALLLPQVFLSEQAFWAGCGLLRPLFPQRGYSALVGTMPGDRHDRGKKLAALFLEANGFTVSDLGEDCPLEQYTGYLSHHPCDLLCCSLTMEEARPVFLELCSRLEELGLRSSLSILIGGIAASEAFCRESGADAYAKTAVQSGEAALLLVSRRLGGLRDREGS